LLKDISIITAIIIEVCIPIALAIFIRKKFKISCSIFFIGLALFLLSLIRIPLNSYVINNLKYYFKGDNLIVLSILFPSLTAAIFEEGFRTLGIGLIIREKTYEKGIMYGVGHGGGGESMILVGGSLTANYIIYKFFPFIPGSSIIKSEFDLMKWYMPLIGSGERILALIIQIALSVLIMQAFIHKKYYLIVFAFLSHIIIDFTAAYFNINFGIMWSEILVTIFALVSIFIILFFKLKDSGKGKELQKNESDDFKGSL
jgi:uncharacterized membrane protein YhfC